MSCNNQTDKQYTVKIKNVNLDSVDDLIINYSDTYGNDMTDKVVRCINKEIKDDNLVLTFESVSEGKVFVDVKKDGNDRYYYSKGLYVHSSGVITEEYYMGNCTFGKTVPIVSFIVLLSSCFSITICNQKNFCCGSEKHT